MLATVSNHATVPGSGVLRVDDLDIHVQVSDQRRTVRLTVERDGSVTAVVPPGLDRVALDKAVKAKRRWIYEKLATARRLANGDHRDNSSPVKGFPIWAAATGCSWWMRPPLRCDSSVAGWNFGATASRTRPGTSPAGTAAPAIPGSGDGSNPGPTVWTFRSPTCGSSPWAIGGGPAGLTAASTSTGPPCSPRPTSLTTSSPTRSRTSCGPTTAPSSGGSSNAPCPTTRPAANGFADSVRTSGSQHTIGPLRSTTPTLRLDSWHLTMGLPWPVGLPGWWSGSSGCVGGLT